MSKFHIGKNGGVSVCKAKNEASCPLGGAHFDNKADAMVRAETLAELEATLQNSGKNFRDLTQDVKFASSNRNGTAHFFELGVTTGADVDYIAEVLARTSSKVGGQNNLGLIANLPVDPATGARGDFSLINNLTEGVSSPYE